MSSHHDLRLRWGAGSGDDGLRQAVSRERSISTNLKLQQFSHEERKRERGLVARLGSDILRWLFDGCMLEFMVTLISLDSAISNAYK